MYRFLHKFVKDLIGQSPLLFNYLSKLYQSKLSISIYSVYGVHCASVAARADVERTTSSIAC